MTQGKSNEPTPLTKADQEELREKLLVQQARLSRDIDGFKADTAEAGEQDFSVDHMADHGSDSYEKDLTLGLMANASKGIENINRALRALDEGKYGTCQACGVIIPKARMQYIPWARFCVECQTMLEHGQLEDFEE